ncbi:MAG: PIN domain-containing protein [Candidatus Micrarchaeota archaeon]
MSARDYNNMPPRLVIIDTNFLLIPFQFRIDMFTELEYLLETSHSYVISSGSIRELKKLADGKGRHAIAARLALKMVDANAHRVEKISSTRNVDDWIVDYAEKTGAIVCTNDRQLRKRLKEAHIKIIALKGKTQLGYI